MSTTINQDDFNDDVNDDDGSGETGTVVNKSFLNTYIFGPINGLFSNSAGITCNGQITANGTGTFNGGVTANGALTANGLITGTSAGLLCNGAIKANTTGIWERGRTIAMGELVTVAYSNTNFGASGSMTWTVDSGDQSVYAYTLVGKQLTVYFKFINTTIGGTPSTDLTIKIPGGFSAAILINGTYNLITAGGSDTGYLQAESGATTIRLLKTGFGNWSTGTNNVQVDGQVSIPIA